MTELTATELMMRYETTQRHEKFSTPWGRLLVIADALDREADDLPPPNEITPRLMTLAVYVRDEAHRIRRLAEASKP